MLRKRHSNPSNTGTPDCPGTQCPPNSNSKQSRNFSLLTLPKPHRIHRRNPEPAIRTIPGSIPISDLNSKHATPTDIGHTYNCPALNYAPTLKDRQRSCAHLERQGRSSSRRALELSIPVVAAIAIPSTTSTDAQSLFLR